MVDQEDWDAIRRESVDDVILLDRAVSCPGHRRNLRDQNSVKVTAEEDVKDRQSGAIRRINYRIGQRH